MQCISTLPLQQIRATHFNLPNIFFHNYFYNILLQFNNILINSGLSNFLHMRSAKINYLLETLILTDSSNT